MDAILLPRLGRAALRHVVDFALPPRCPACGTIVPGPNLFCLACWQSLAFLGEPCCARCGLPFGYESGADAECGRCLAEPPPFARLRAAVAYGDTARKVALKLKYSGRPGIAETLAHFMMRQLPALGGEGGGEALLVPVPLHRWRMWKRGYNQAALIASALSRRSGIACELDLLRRIRATPPLKGLGRRERAMAVRGVFAVPKDLRPRLKGRAVILVDDVFTSGATAGACARTLRRAGARSVVILTWSRVVRTDVD